MRPYLLLLHVLFSLALVANGIGTAMASLNAECAHARIASAPAAESQPCHEDMSAVGTAGDTSEIPSAAPDREDCCDDCSNRCDCGGCLAHSHAALLPPTLLLSVTEGIDCPVAHVHARATPALPHPVRPPIG